MTSLNSTSRWRLVFAFAVLGFASTLAPGQLVKMYELTELGADQAIQSRAYALNSTGQAVGWVQIDDSVRHSAQWQNQSRTDLHNTMHFQLLHPYRLFDQNYGEAFDISDGDQIVGTARTQIKLDDTLVIISQAYVLRPGVLTDLGTPYPGDALTNLGIFGHTTWYKSAFDSAAVGISNRNHVVGWADRDDGVIHAFLVTPRNGKFFLDVLPPPVPPLTIPGDGVNDLMIDLGILAASADPVSSATAVNDSGQVTGFSYTTASAGRAGYHAFLVTPTDTDGDGLGDTWFTGDPNVGVNGLMRDLGTLGGVNSWGRDINNNGEVVGEADLDTAAGEHFTRAFLWKNNAMFDLGSLQTDRTRGNSAASGINNRGAVVGWAENDRRERRAFIYENGVMRDLNAGLYLIDANGNVMTPSVILTEARDINDDGVIVGWGTLRGTNDITRGFLLNPVMVDPSQYETDPQEVAEDYANNPTTRPSGQFTSATDFGPPDGEADSEVLAETESGPTRVPGLCGFGTLALAPLTALGIGWLKRKN